MPAFCKLMKKVQRFHAYIAREAKEGELYETDAQTERAIVYTELALIKVGKAKKI